MPCDPVQDPFLSGNISHSWPNSVLITSYNNLVKPLGNFSTGRNHITFYVYVPNGKSGNFGLLSKFIPDSIEIAFECNFDTGGTGRLTMIPGEPIFFNYTNNQWHQVWVVVDFYFDEAEFWFDNYLIHTWEWTQNGTIASQLAANNFSGISSNSEIYIDDYYSFENNCLFCYPPDAPSNLTAEVSFNPDTLVKLNWQINFGIGMPYGCKILRKNGLPNKFIPYEIIGTTLGFDSTYIDTNVLMDSTYTYAVMAFNVFGNSDTSNIETLIVDPVTSILYSNSISAYSLSQNYPNPFNSSTTIAYIIKERSFVSLIVVNEEQGPGTYRVKFEKNNLASGMYFFRLVAGEFDQTRKMVHLK